ncbi:hypothetical protein GGF46_003272 [Coemansia sp. RSA 552]|nr:hypothetical protein GGF46_003272 [Coemansia sp. RSA 552]
MEKEILRLYQERIDKYDQIFRNVERDLDSLKVSQRELTELQWENNRLTAEADDLRADAAELHSSLVKERRSHLEAVAENDRLRIREHELDRRVRLLADVSARYYEDRDGVPSPSASPSTTATLRPQKRPRQKSLSSPHADEDAISRTEYERRQLEIENESLQLSIETMRIQLHEQKANYAEIIDGLTGELHAYKAASAKASADRLRRSEALEAEVARIKGLYRENLRDLVAAQRTALDSKHSVKQDNLVLRSEILALQRRLDVELERGRFLQTTAPVDFPPDAA